MGINREEFEPWFGGFHNRISCVLTASLASHASTSLIVSRKDLAHVRLIYRREIEETMDNLLGTVVILEFLPCVQR